MADDDEDEAAAAAKMQAVQRGKEGRKASQEKREKDAASGPRAATGRHWPR